MRELTTDTLQDEVSNNDLVFVQFSAGWCGNCRIMKPKFKKFSTEVEGAEFLVVDAEKNPESRKLADVSNLPTFAAFRNGELVKQVQTNKTDVLKSFIDEVTSN
ncbi:thioredoxin family protein [Wenyingzhuangia aestuarii]|uniref:thioredoxin family protein n=1 Tax=Wenyingzhuangia aestuarii TaxID=1647582 RepID=UPI00143B587E|nr:thioredoxin family protein [Wenyingzhuangia aestuarii]NJB81675.1 thiol-disulfide isomerase/thioredoxin [Wenyingzhuangia aestuarii]